MKPYNLNTVVLAVYDNQSNCFYKTYKGKWLWVRRGVVAAMVDDMNKWNLKCGGIENRYSVKKLKLAEDV